MPYVLVLIYNTSNIFKYIKIKSVIYEWTVSVTSRSCTDSTYWLAEAALSVVCLLPEWYHAHFYEMTFHIHMDFPKYILYSILEHIEQI